MVLLRHGKSTWNKSNRFTGWVDVPLAAEGRQEAVAAAHAMQAADLHFDAAYVSNLKRALSTLWTVLETMDTMWLSQTSDWRLNERHYGNLQGLDKTQTAAQYGEGQVRQWRRSFDIAPPSVTAAQPLFAGVEQPQGESLKDILPRVQAVYREGIAPLLEQGKQVLVVAHGNSLRALVKQIEKISDEDIMNVEIATAVPWVYRLDARLQVADKKVLARR